MYAERVIMGNYLGWERLMSKKINEQSIERERERERERQGVK